MESQKSRLLEEDLEEYHDDGSTKEEGSSPPEHQNGRRRRSSPWPLWTLQIILFVVLLFSTNMFTASMIHARSGSSRQQQEDPASPEGYAITEPYISLETQYRPIHWNTEYSHHNRSISDPLWDAILPSHGFIAMDRTSIKQQGWPESMYLPSDKGRGVYLLEAYHHIHCLRILRKTFWEAVEGKPYTFPPNAHIDHCFDTLRQSVMCYADATPLFTFGDFTAGDGQLHKCKNWNQLREYATKNTACYVDGRDDDLLKDHFGTCDDGDDHLRIGTGIPRA